jgi:hypothetical protein
MTQDNHSDSDGLARGRLFIHGRLNDPMTGGPLYCRIRGVESDLVEYEERFTTGRTARSESRHLGGYPSATSSRPPSEAGMRAARRRL